MNKQVLFRRQQAGFSLLEVMIAVVIGMLAMVTVLKIFGASEARKRITTGANDAQLGGVLALNSLQRDIRQAGYGMTSMALLGCSVTSPVSNATITGLAPVTINHASIPAGDDDTDTLLIAYGVGNGAPEGDVVTSQPSTKSYLVANPTQFAVDDWVIAEPGTPPSPCALTLDRVTATPSSGTEITVATGTTGMSFGTLYNLGHNILVPSSGPKLGPQFLAYRVLHGDLTVCDYMVNNCGDTAKKNDATVWTPIASNIVSLRAQYGRDNTKVMDGVVDKFDQTTPTAGAAFACGIARISAVRLALVARSGDFDKSAPTTVAPVWDGSVADNPAGSQALPIKLSSENSKLFLPAGADWKNYRYKVYQTVIPIRTTTWMEPNSGCTLP
jgi:type IV pilus assembly protein PilW